MLIWVSGAFRYKGQAPDLLGKQDSVYEGERSCGLKAELLSAVFAVSDRLVSGWLQRTGTCWMLTKTTN